MAALSSSPRGNNTERIPVVLERAFLVARRDVESGLVPAAEPVVLIDVVDARDFVGTRFLEVVNAPRILSASSLSYDDLVPLFVIDWDEAWRYENARPATIIRDRRTSRAEDYRPSFG
jgi:hypothetical protein